MKQYFVYILASQKNGTLYIGVTSNLEKRIHEHKNELSDGFTKQYSVHKLVYFEETNEVYSALQREKNLKYWKREWKVQLIESVNPNWDDLSLDSRVKPKNDTGDDHLSADSWVNSKNDTGDDDLSLNSRVKSKNDTGNREEKKVIPSITPLLQKKRFIMRNENFTCENCDKEVSLHPTGSARNHCPFCLYSKHLDKEFPGDRASECSGIMKPVGKDHKKNKGWMIQHECQTCHKKILNKVAEDDDMGVYGKL